MSSPHLTGVFRISCEVTLRLLRENKDCLMNVLDAFVHDPLVEWEEKRRRMERHNHVQADMRAVSQDALGPIDEKLRGIFRPLKSSPGKQMTVTNHVQSLIQQASDNANLVRTAAYTPQMTTHAVAGTHVHRLGPPPMITP